MDVNNLIDPAPQRIAILRGITKSAFQLDTHRHSVTQ